MSEQRVATETVTEAKPKKRRTRLLLMVVVPTLALLVGIAIYLHSGRIVETDNAYVKADKVRISPEVTGIISAVEVSENQHVNQGDVLFQIDPQPFKVAVAKASANLAQVKTDLAALKASYFEKKAELALAESRYAFAQSEERRQTDLLAKNYISGSQFDATKQNSDVARLQIQAVREDLKRIEESLGGRLDSPVEQHPNYMAAKAELESRELDLRRTTVVAPQTGIVHSIPLKGQYLPVGTTAMALVVDDNLWIEANYTETSLTYVQPGQQVQVFVDTYPGVEWLGVVESVSPATSAEFSILPAQNATGNWVKIAQRVPVRIRLEPNANAPKLRAGLSVITEIDTGHQRSLMGITL
ncbi:HlyD family secretion protein [Alteromonas pelagimontana]|uniref:HlyD family secretion protein n=1 Tax=Alteromonas pelagimontana TaxID=1858656 RepID=A0A6M4MC24_9ALTE|nr:HlyD family secretion protein [Alteromonas pelagimontana]QJR80358.1 HlyD family secretion protein [Alteromonas pelagimontana]